MSSSFLWLAELLHVTTLPRSVRRSKESPRSFGQAWQGVFLIKLSSVPGSLAIAQPACGRGGPMAIAPMLQPQHSASTVGTPGLPRANHKPGPAALHSSRVGPWGAVITSCQQPHGAHHPHSSQRAGMCPGLVHAPGSALKMVWFCSQCQALLLNTPARRMLQFPWVSCVSAWTCKGAGSQGSTDCFPFSPHKKWTRGQQ